MNSLILMILILFSVSIAFGAVEIEDVTFGFNEGYKTGTWAPLTVTVRSQDEPVVFAGELAVEVQNFTSDTPLERYATPLRLSPTGRQQKQFYVYCSKNATRLIVQLVPAVSVESNLWNSPLIRGDRGGGTLLNAMSPMIQEISLPIPIARKDYLVLVLAPSGDRLKRFIDKKSLKVSDGAEVHVKYLPNSTSLLSDWIGYNAVDVLVIRGTFLTERHVSKAQQAALLDWVQRGGTLITSGGSSFDTLQGSFLEPFLPVELKGLKKTNAFPDALYEQLGFQSSSDNRTFFERIEFMPKAGCETLVGTTEHIYVAKRNFGNGQILCLAFDYNAPPFSEQEVGEAFWYRLLSESGKSPRHLADRYAPARQHEEKIHKQFLSKMPTQVPLVRLLAVILPAYLLAFGGFLLYFRKSKQKSSVYWIGSCLFVLLSVSTIALARNILPDSIGADRLSILSIYSERQRGHLQSFVSIRTTSRTKTSIKFPEGTFIRHQETELFQKLGTLIQGSHVQLQDVSVEPWHPTTYVQEAFTQQLPVKLETAWSVTKKEITYLGNIRLKGQEPFLTENGMTTNRRPVKIPPDKELSGVRKAFARILQQEGVLQYLTNETCLNQRPYIIGWTSRDFTDIATDQDANANDETLVIFRPTDN
ncbi:MAG: hypothetical protein OXU36_16240 [Candidatus Poribacteria bacterium]|nr:hypothetical protein [Candidatus Poribacteria bacterium]